MIECLVISLLGSGEQSFELVLVISIQIIEVFHLVAMGLLFSLGSLGVFTNDLLNLILELLDLLIMLSASSFEIRDVLLHFVLSLFGHKSFAHSICD